MRRRLILIAVLLAAAPSAAEDETAIVVYGPRVPPAHCSAARARPMPLADYAADPDRYAGKCLRIDGLLIGRMLFASEDDYYRRGPYENGPEHPPSERNWIGLYMTQRDFGRVDHFAASRAEVIGLAGQCGDLEGPNVLMVAGTCHYTDVPYLAVASVRARPVPLVRLTGAEARARVGDIHDMPPDDPRRARVEPQARAWFAAIAAGDRAAYGRLTDAYSKSDELMRYVFDKADSPFADLRRRADIPQIMFFADNTSDASPQLKRLAITCVCRKPDCAGLWPISAGDAANAPQRPYICAEIWLDEGVLGVEFEIDDRALIEPAEPRH